MNGKAVFKTATKAAEYKINLLGSNIFCEFLENMILPSSLSKKIILCLQKEAEQTIWFIWRQTKTS
jgi:hypothetical protein